MAVDAYLVDGDYVYDGAGGVKSSDDERDALLRRCLDRLKARRGGCLLEPEFGSRLWTIGREERRGRESAAMRYASEALEPEGVSVRGASVVELGGGAVCVSVTVEIDGDSQVLSVTI